MNDLIYQAMIPLNPRTKKNDQQIIVSKKTGKRKIIQGERYLRYETDAGWFLRKPPVPISQAVNVKVLFYRDSERRVDLTNLLEAIDDILVKYKILADDNYKVVSGHDGSRVLIDRDHPRTEIYIQKISDYN